MTAVGEDEVPPQWKPQEIYDFRHGADGPRGYKVGVNKFGNLGSKRKLDEYSEQVEREQAEAAMREGEPQLAAGSLKRPKLNTVGVGKGSGRAAWKQPAPRASTLRNPGLTSSWDKKMKDKAERAAYVNLKREVSEGRKTAAREARERKEEAQRRKEENRKKSQITTKISSATARKMAKNKKLKKKLVMVDG